MRRFGLTVVAVFCLASVSFAAGNQPTNEKWEGRINVYKLSNYLQLNFQEGSREVASQRHLRQLEADEKGSERKAICRVHKGAERHFEEQGHRSEVRKQNLTDNR